MRKPKSVVLILVILMSLLLTGCGAKTPTGDLPAGANTAGVADSGRETGELKPSEENADQQEPSSQVPENAQNSQGASPSQSQPPQPDTTNQESKPTIAISSTSPNGSSSGTNGLAAVPAPAPAAPDLNVNPIPPSPDPNLNPNPKNIVTFSINCQTAVDKGLHQDKKYQEVVPADGIILAPTVVEFKEGEVVFDVLKQVVRQHKIHMEYEGSKGTPYIQGINNLYEFDGGPLSGWMYCVNKVYPNYGCGEYKLKPGDIIEWNYTCDLGKDLGQTWLGE
ncbi:DUF4430 domain-containing protein [Desulfosporosinus meridiei]|uniref:DUF4430 domain-containing protein n=1 Tax=Desulfosporosinus meridiei TaxID=79209 RepID=UPI00030ACAEB|nr:DUF4430 domain-containing protein [Desulfosporosinus meridiei]